jgi:hypothetical protein
VEGPMAKMTSIWPFSRPFCLKMLATAVRRCFSSFSTGITNEIEVRGCFGLTHKPYPIRSAQKASAGVSKTVFGLNSLLRSEITQ